MRVGTVCYDTMQGIGIMAKQFYDAGIVTDVVVVEHGRRPSQGWYPDALRITNLRDPQQQLEAVAALSECDVCLFFETQFIPGIVSRLKAKGIKSALIPMHECTPRDHERPAMYLCPSDTEQKLFSGYGTPCFQVQIPVYLDAWKLRGEVRTFVHNAGHGGLKGRNGTAELIEALKHVTKPCKLILRSQDRAIVIGDPGVVQVSQTTGTVPHNELYAEGEAFIFPEHFQGQSYPLEEAYAAGMYTMALDRPPMNKWLPREGLIPVASLRTDRVGSNYFEYMSFTSSPTLIAKAMDDAVGKDVAAYSKAARSWACKNTWGTLDGVYRNYLGTLC